MYDNSSRVIEVEINDILPNRFQPRIQFEEEEILELSDSIKEHGVIQPLVVRSVGDKYEIIAGERRYKASVLAGKETVPVIVKNLNDKDSAEIALIENIQRKNLTPIEEALSYKKILDMGYITQENLASKLGKSQPAVANKIRLLNLPEEVQEALLENKISERHARSLLKLATKKQQNEMLNRIINERLTVRRTDEEINKIKEKEEGDSEEATQKIKEKGEIDMNNNMFEMPNISQTNNQGSNFDIFGGTPTVQTTPAVEPVMPSFATLEANSVEPQSTSFDIFGGTPTVQTTPAVEPVMPSFAQPAVISVEPQSTSFDIFGGTPNVQPTPVVEPVMPSTPIMGGIEFDPNGNLISAPTMENTVVSPEPIMESQMQVNAPVVEEPVIPSTPIMRGIEFDENVKVTSNMENTIDLNQITPNISSIPQTAPIIEIPQIDNNDDMPQQIDNLFSFGANSINSVPNQSEETEIKIPEPIIITDYSKQYDPIMPETKIETPVVDFKEVINAIRECSNKIEKYGFKIDVEEYDLANLYQVIFKIDK